MHLFITGAYRSGTTLVEKLLHQHPQVCVASQPFPFLYTNVKQAFLDDFGIAARYPLGHGFLSRYEPERWWAFLDRFHITTDRLDGWIAAQSGYSGHWTPQLEQLSGRLAGGLLRDVHEQVQARVAQALGLGHARVHGSKEILCEEYLPCLITAGHRVVLVLRDVRAVLASLLGAGGQRYGGAHRPVLFTVRLWRKSVAYALAFRDDPRVRVVCYEDVLADRDRVLDGLRAWLALDHQAGWGVGELLDQQGGAWSGNSSFGRPGGPAEQRRRVAAVLPGGTLRYAEACAYPELVALGYPVDAPSPSAWEDFAEPVPVERAEFHPGYSTLPEHLVEERERLRLAREPLGQVEGRRWFLFPAAHDALRAALTREPRDGTAASDRRPR